MQTLAELENGIAAANKLLVELQQARATVIAKREAACLRDFDNGIERRTICDLHGVTYPALSALLWRNKRTRKSRIVSGLTLPQRRHFGSLIRNGFTPKAARNIALSLTAHKPGMQQEATP